MAKRPDTPQGKPRGIGATLLGHAGQSVPAMPDFDALRANLRRPEATVAKLARADSLRHLGRAEEAVALYRECAADSDPAIAATAAHFLAALGAAPQPDAASDRYVKTLFDAYAPGFEADLVNALGYDGPRALYEAVVPLLADRADPAIADAGCGTGLCGALFRPVAGRLDGIDLSPKMLAEAAKKGIFDALIEGDVCACLEARPDSYDLILAGDVLIYLGAPEPVMQAAARALRPGGLFALTTERGDVGVRLDPSGRYSHADAAIETAAQTTGLSVRHKSLFTLRHQNERKVPGTVFVLGRSLSN